MGAIVILKLYTERERLAFWQEWLHPYAVQVQAPIGFNFVRELLGQSLLQDWTIHGRTTWQGDHYQITVRNDLDPDTEQFTVAHELAHVLLHHVPRVETSPALQNIQNANYAKWTQGKTSATVTAQTNERERSADALAHKLIKEWEKLGIHAK